jgi:hypothetical protein
MVACGLRGGRVFVDESAQELVSVDPRRGRVDGGSGCFRRLEREGAVRPVLVEMGDVGSENSVEVASIQDEDAVEAVVAECPDPTLGVGVRVGGTDGGVDDPDALASDHGVEVDGELAVAIADQILEAALLIVELHDQVARLLGDPAPVRVLGGRDELDSATLK